MGLWAQLRAHSRDRRPKAVPLSAMARRSPGRPRCHRAMASPRLPARSLVKIRLMWFFTVFWLMKQAAAIC